MSAELNSAHDRCAVSEHLTAVPVNSQAVVRGALARLSAGTGGVVVVEGPAGTGKTTLFEYAARASRDLGFAVAVGRASAVDRAIPLSTLVTVLRSCPDLESMAAGIGAWESNRLKLLDWLRSGLERVLAAERLVVAVDNLHSADELTILILRMLLPSFRERPVLWLLALRPQATRSTGVDVIESLVADGAVRTTLGALTDDAVTDLCARVLGASPAPDVLAVAARAGGNPRLCHDLIRSLDQENAIAVRDGVARLVGNADQVPEQCVQAVMEFLGDLSSAALALLRAGAVLGTRFTVHEITLLTGRPFAEVLAATREALAADLLTGCGSELTFRHGIVRDVLYDQLGEPVRMAMHREAVAVVRAEGRGAEEIGTHLILSGAGGVAAESEVLLQVLRDRATHSPAAGAEFALRALDLLDDRHPIVGQLVVEAVRLLGLSGQWIRAKEVGERALGTLMDPDTETTLLLRLIEVTQDGGDCGAVLEYTRRVLSRSALTERFRAELLATQAYVLAVKGDPGEADQVAQEAIKLCEDDQRDTLMLGVLARGVAAWARCAFATAFDLVREAVRIADSLGTRMSPRHPRVWLGLVLTDLDRFDEAAAASAGLIDQSVGGGRGFLSPIGCYQQARLRFAEGRLAEAETATLAGVAAAESGCVPAQLVRLLCLAVEIHLARNDLPAAEECLRRAEKLVNSVSAADRAEVVWRRVLLQEAAGRTEDAVRGAVGLHAAVSTSLFLMPALPIAAPTLVRLILRGGNETRARAIACAIRDLAVQSRSALSLEATATHVEGLIEGDPGLLAAAAEKHRLTGWRFGLAAAWEDAGQAAAARGNTTAARELWDEAAKAWSSCGAIRYANRVADAVVRLSAVESDESERVAHLVPVPREHTVRAAPVAPVPVAKIAARLANLTDTELQVARLVARGMTNKEIANYLVLSPHTVATHVRNSFTKLDVTNRVELTIKVLMYDCENQLATEV